MQFDGVNKRVQVADLPPGESPDATNCHYFDGQLGLLGPRKGRSFHNATAYGGGAVMGLLRFYIPGVRSWFVATTDGAIVEETAPYNDANPAYTFGVRGGKGQTLATPLSATVTYPATTATSTSSFAGSATLPALQAGEIVVVDAASPAFTFADSVVGDTATAAVTVELGVVVGGTPYYTTCITDTRTKDQTSALGAGATTTLTTPAGLGYGKSYLYISSYPGSGVITGLALRLTVAWTNCASGVVTFSGINQGTIY